MIGMSEPIIAGAFAWLALDEKLGPFQILGAFGVLAGIAVAERSRAGKPLMPRRRRLAPVFEPEMPIVVLGGGVTGLHAVHELRRNGITTPITIIGSEPATEEIPAVTWEPLVFPTKVDVTGGTIQLSDGRSLSTRGIINSTTAAPWDIEIPGPRGGLRAVYRPVDIDIVARDITDAQRVLVIGGTVMGSELASRARDRGAQVTIVTKDDDVMTKALGSVIGGITSRLHEFHGVRVIRERIPVEFLGDEHGTATGVMLDDGTRIDADVIVQASGTIPIVEFDEVTATEQALAGLLAELSPSDSDEPVAAWTSTQYGAYIEGWGAPGADNDVQIITETYDDATGQITRLIAAYWDADGLTGVVGINAGEGLTAYRRQLRSRRLSASAV
jgi:thioredoxin reductase